MQGVNTSPQIFLFVHFLNAGQGSGAVLVAEFSVTNIFIALDPNIITASVSRIFGSRRRQ